jgi:hypothetical protein
MNITNETNQHTIQTTTNNTNFLIEQLNKLHTTQTYQSPHNQRINQSTNQSIKHARINSSITHSIINQSVKQQSINQTFNEPQSINKTNYLNKTKFKLNPTLRPSSLSTSTPMVRMFACLCVWLVCWLVCVVIVIVKQAVAQTS